MQRQFGVLRALRLLVLMVVLVAVAGETWLVGRRTTDWDAPLWVTIYPINADGRATTTRYIDALETADFGRIEAYFRDQAAHRELAVERPFELRLGGEIAALPPVPPADGATLGTMLWSLRMRYWAWRRSSEVEGPPADIRLFVKYFDPQVHDRLDHSLGLRKGMLGVVNAFAAPEYAGQNQVVIAHEMLHTVGASDKYDLVTSQPLYPAGYAEPQRSPRHPQRWAELMGGRIPLSPSRAEIPRSLRLTLIGEQTAREIRWLTP